MESMGADEYVPTFYIGHHESERVRVTPELLSQAQDCNYDMLTSPITTPLFRARVLTLVSNHLEELENHPGKSIPVPTIPSLSPFDTPLVPNEIVSQSLAVASPWIDLCSPDPVIYNVSRQVLQLEVAYAAFCGIGNVILPAPRLHHGKIHGEGHTQYAYAIQEALSTGQYVQFSVSLPMMDYPEDDEYDGTSDENDSLAARARGRYMGLSEEDYENVSMEEGQEPGEMDTSGHSSKKAAKFDFFGTWDAWNVIRTVCKYNNRLFVALNVPRRLPPPSVQSRWHSEPLRILKFHRTTFDEDSKSSLFITKFHQALLTRYMRIRQPPWLLLCDVGPIPGTEAPEVPVTVGSYAIPGDSTPNSEMTSLPTPAEASDLQRHAPSQKSQKAKSPLAHLEYLRKLQHRQPPRDIIERFGAGYQDYLQAPLQPLTDNLESITYEVFEKDPIKYDQYLKAIQQALLDWRNDNKPASGIDGRIVVAVVGAGRGPLVTRALEASDSTGVPIEMWALEKNPNAFVLLQRHNKEIWGGRVNLVKSDMRSWKGPTRQPSSPPQRAWPLQAPSDQPSTSQDPFNPAPNTSTSPEIPIDILISELLGSFGDNELSPECLDPLLPLLNRTHGISIPASYTAYLTPIAAPKLHADISTRASTDASAPDTPYVVMLHSVDYLSTTTRPIPANPGPTQPPPPTSTTTTTTPTPSTPTTKKPPSTSLPPTTPNVKPAWSFTHTPTPTTPQTNTHNTRHARLTFPLRDRATTHGLAGFFEALLYPGVELSTNPQTMEMKSPGMMSWFPIYFPLKTPLTTPDFSSLVVEIFRATDGRKVWYEWVVEGWLEGGVTGGNGGRGGRGRVRLGVSERGCSRGGGCLM